MEELQTTDDRYTVNANVPKSSAVGNNDWTNEANRNRPAVDEWANHDVRDVTLDGGRGKLPNDPTLVCDQNSVATGFLAVFSPPPV